MSRIVKWLPMLLLVALGGFVLAPALDAGEMSGMKKDMMFWLGDAEEKLLELGEATPEDKFTWRPAEGVRSTGEVFLHVAAANYGLPSFWGVKAPEGFAFDGYEQSMTKKAEIMAALKASFAHMKAGLESATDEDMMKEVNLFGQLETSVRGGYFLMLSHAHEHLGQSIAYARSNEIAPPWTARQQAAAKAAAEKAKAASAEKTEMKKKGK